MADPAATSAIDPAPAEATAGSRGTPPPTPTDDAGAETKGERTRRRILEMAIERFGERGYRAASVSEIARAAGLTQAAAYAYFENKEALFDAAVDTDAAAAIGKATESVRDVAANQLVPMLLVSILGDLDRHPLAKRVLGGQENEALQRLVNLPALGDLCQLIATRVAEAQDRGEVRADLDAQMFANGAETLLLTLLIAVVQVGSTTEARRQMGVVTIFDAVLRPPAP